VKHLIRHIVWVALAIVLLTVTLRIIIEGRRELAAGQSQLESGNVIRAQQHFLTAARWYLPLLGTTDAGVRALLELGDDFFSQGKYQAAVSAYDDARGALYAVTWLAGPDQDLLARADAGYASALAHWHKQLKPETVIEEAESRYLAAASSPRLPNPWWSLLMGLSFLSYIGCLGRVAWKWDDSDFARRPWLAGAAVAFILWIVAMFLI
jgi:hypothetical protein